MGEYDLLADASFISQNPGRCNEIVDYWTISLSNVPTMDNSNIYYTKYGTNPTDYRSYETSIFSMHRRLCQAVVDLYFCRS